MRKKRVKIVRQGFHSFLKGMHTEIQFYSPEYRTLWRRFKKKFIQGKIK